MPETKKKRTLLPGHIWYKLRGAIFLPPFLVMTFCLLGETETDAVIWPVGLTLFAIGFAIRTWAQIHLGYRLAKHKDLTTTGPYVYVRNPIYIGNTLVILGACVLSELIWFVPVMIVWCIVGYTLVIRYEERHLLEKYGQPYADFLAAVPRWIPKFSRKTAEKPETRGLFWPSVGAELHNFLYLLPVIAKELFIEDWLSR